MFKHYRSAVIFSVVALAFAAIDGGMAGLAIAAFLAILETCLSFDNAVVNATILNNWDDKWRKRFLTWGMPVAVFGMRFFFPVLIVSVVTGLGLWGALSLIMENPKQFEHIMLSVHHEVAAFGGAFLMMVGLKFLLDEEKDVHWIQVIEAPLAKAGRLPYITVFTTLAVVYGASLLITGPEQHAFFVAGVMGVLTYIAADWVGTVLGDGEGKVVKASWGGLMYLELLDASFSFDGVIAGLAMTAVLPILAAGLGIGAMWVRSMTIHLVETGKMNEFKFLEHSAFWTINLLAISMFVSVSVEIPEWITGLMGVLVIGTGLYHSVLINKREAISNHITDSTF